MIRAICREATKAFEAYLKEAKPGKTIATLAEAEWCDKQLYEEFAGFLFSTPIPKGRKNAGEPYSAGSITNYVQTILNLGAAMFPRDRVQHEIWARRSGHFSMPATALHRSESYLSRPEAPFNAAGRAL